MLTSPVRSRGARLRLGFVLMVGLAGAMAVASVGLLRGARSVHVRPMMDGIGAEAATAGMGAERTAFHASLRGVGHP